MSDFSKIKAPKYFIRIKRYCWRCSMYFKKVKIMLLIY